MTRAYFKARGALQAARALRSLLDGVFRHSVRQMELLESGQYDALEQVLAEKQALLDMLGLAVQEARERGWELDKPATWPADESCARLLREAHDLSGRVQAHEKYCLGEMIVRRNHVGDRLAILASKRNAASGYRTPVSRGRAIDTSR